MAQITLTASALQDLDGIWDYIAVENQSPIAADSLVDEIGQTIQMLAEHPLIGEVVVHLRPNTRRVVIRARYLLFYETSETAILVLRVLHGARLIRPEDFTF